MILSLLLAAVSVRASSIDTLFARGHRCFEAGDYGGMLGFYSQALKLAEQHDVCTDLILSSYKVGSAYYYLRQRSNMWPYFYQATLAAERCPQDTLLSRLYRVIGSLHFEERRLDSSRYYLKRTEQMLLKTEKWDELSSLYAIMGEAYEENDDAYFDLAEKYALLTRDTSLIAFAYVKQGTNAIEAKNCEEGERYLKLGLDYYRHARYPDGEMYALRELAKAYNECNNAPALYGVFWQHSHIIDSIFRAETAEKTAHYRTLYETEKKERENIELSKKRRQLIGIFAVTLLVLVLVFFIVYARYRLRKQKELSQFKANQQQDRFAAVVEAEERERERIATDLHDGLGQIMSAAKINLGILQDEISFKDEAQQDEFRKIVALVDESCREVRTVSHSMMPNTLLKSGLASAIRNFLNQISYKALEIHFYAEGLDSALNSSTETVLYRVVQECVNNVIKHAQASRLHISIIRDAEGISLTVEDNGRGFDARNTDHTEGIGLKNIRSRIGYLGGTVEWDSAPGKGTVVVINIPAS